MNVVRYTRDRSAQRRRDGSPPDKTFCVVDIDHHKTLDPAKNFAAAHKLDRIISSPRYTDVDLVLLALLEAAGSPALPGLTDEHSGRLHGESSASVFYPRRGRD